MPVVELAWDRYSHLTETRRDFGGEPCCMCRQISQTGL
jgi:hypothetical protein